MYLNETRLVLNYDERIEVFVCVAVTLDKVKTELNFSVLI
jgi:hypothetical protein